MHLLLVVCCCVVIVVVVVSDVLTVVLVLCTTTNCNAFVHVNLGLGQEEVYIPSGISMLLKLVQPALYSYCLGLLHG